MSAGSLRWESMRYGKTVSRHGKGTASAVPPGAPCARALTPEVIFVRLEKAILKPACKSDLA